jgi:uncharacterized protein (UPF0261 family)
MAILLIGTLDTKGPEIAYVRDRICALGGTALVLDSGILGEPVDIVPDITRSDVALAAGSTIDALRNAGTRGAAVERMKEGVKQVTLDLFAQGKLHGVLCLGGAEGAVLGATAMRALPIGVPKILVTPLASGKRTFGTFMGTRDIFVLHSVIDIAGLNPISCTVFDNAAAAAVGMAQAGYHPIASAANDGKRYVALTMLGNTTRAVMRVKERIAAHGYESIIFHSNGVGGPAMEDLAERGMFTAVIDYTTDELTDQSFGGFHQGGEKRLERVGAIGLPQIVVPGNIDFMVHGPRDQVPDRFAGRPAYYHNPEFTLIRVLKDEMAQLGHLMARKLNGARGPIEVVVPTQGLSIPNVPGGLFWDPEADAAFLDALRADLRSDVPIIVIEDHVNSISFADRVADEFLKLMTV